MKLMVIGGGGREHAIAQSLLKDSRVEKLWCAPGNGGIAADATCVPIGAKDIDGIVKKEAEKISTSRKDSIVRKLQEFDPYND